jgi:hypothetical protein
MERLFLRLRTNSLDDVVRKALVPLCRIDPAHFSAEVVEVPSVGEFRGEPARYESEISGESGLVWTAHTFVVRH